METAAQTQELGTGTAVVETPIDSTPSTTIATESNTSVTEINTTPTVDYESILKERTGGKISSFDEIENIFKENESLKNTKHEYSNELAKKVDDYFKSGGNDIDSFIKIQKIDVDKLTDLDLAKAYYKEVEKTDMNDEELEEFLVEKYKFDPNDEIGYSRVEKNKGKIEFKNDSKLFKQELSKWKASADIQIEPQVAPAEIERQQQFQQNQQNFLKTVISEVSSLNDFDLKVKLDNLELETKMPVFDKSKLLDVASDLYGNKFWQLMSKEDGTFDRQKSFRVMNYAINPEAYDNELIKKAYAKGVESVISGAKNPNLSERSTNVAKTVMTEQERRKWMFDNNK